MEEPMRMRKLQIRRIAPGRWALLHIPPGLITGLVFGLLEGADPADKTSLCLLTVPLGALAFFLFSWLQASLINGYFHIMRGGPVIEVAELPGQVRESPVYGRQWERLDPETIEADYAKGEAEDPTSTSE